MDAQYLVEVSSYYGRQVPAETYLVGYSAIIKAHNLDAPSPSRLSLISKKSKKDREGQWDIYSKNYKPEDTLYKQLVFALKYEGIHLLIFKKLFEKIEDQDIIKIVQEDPKGIYSRKIWYLYEWLMQKTINLDDADSKLRFVDLADSKKQYTSNVEDRSKRHRVNNNLLGNRNFCPSVFKTPQLEYFIQKDLKDKVTKYQNNINRKLLRRAYGFLILKDTKSSYSIEGEKPPKYQRSKLWSDAVKQAGKYELNKEELLRLQELVIERNKARFQMGFRAQGGFIGEHDRDTNQPLPEHISCKAEDISDLIEGLIHTNKKLIQSDLDPIISAAIISFGFVFIHPFVDGNGRVHRYLIHHVLAKKEYSNSELIFPISSAIENSMKQYGTVLEAYSGPLLDYVDYEVTDDLNVKVLNETADYYKYFDCTVQASYLYQCVEDTIDKIIPEEIDFLKNYDEFEMEMEEEFEIPNKDIKLLFNFLMSHDQHQLSERKRKKYFQHFSKEDCVKVEAIFKSIYFKE